MTRNDELIPPDERMRRAELTEQRLERIAEVLKKLAVAIFVALLVLVCLEAP